MQLKKIVDVQYKARLPLKVVESDWWFWNPIKPHELEYLKSKVDFVFVDLSNGHHIDLVDEIEGDSGAGEGSSDWTDEDSDM